MLLALYIRMRTRIAREIGQTTAEYALVILAAAAVAVVLIAWARSSGKLPAFFDNIIDQVARDQLLLVQAARAGTRQAVVDPDDGAVRSVALEAAPGLDPTRVEVTVDRTGGLGRPVEVTMGYEARIAVPLAGLFFPSEVGLEASTAMRQEFP